MNLNYLQEFLMLAQTKSYSVACELLYMNQSTLSKHIKTLEAELGVPLFNRTTRNVELTPFGEHLYPYAEQICDLSHKYSLELAKKTQNILSLGLIPSMSFYGMIEILYDFYKKYPDIEVAIDEADSAELKKNLLDGRSELTIMRKYEAPFYHENYDEAGIVSIPICNDYLVALIPKVHKMAKVKQVTLQDLEKVRLCTMQKNTMHYDICMKAFNMSDIVPNIYYTSQRVKNILETSLKADCIALLMSPPFTEMDGASDIVHRDFNIVPVVPKITSTLALCHLKDKQLSSPAKEFIKYFKKAIK